MRMLRGRAFTRRRIAPAVFLHLSLEPSLQIGLNVGRKLVELDSVMAFFVGPRNATRHLRFCAGRGNRKAKADVRAQAERCPYGNRGAANTDIQERGLKGPIRAAVSYSGAGFVAIVVRVFSSHAAHW